MFTTEPPTRAPAWRRRQSGRPWRWLPALVAAAVLVVAGCGAGEPRSGGDRAGSGKVSAGGLRSLRGICPETVVIQTNWWPQAEYGAIYHLLGRSVSIDKNKKRVSGPLVSAGVDTGVRVEIRAGGPANSFTPSATVLYLDKTVILGGVDIDQAVQVAATQPVRAVFAPLDLSPVVLMWDPTQHPHWNTITDIGQTDTRVLYYQGATYMNYLVGSGILRRSQVDPSYDGTPSRFVAERGKVAQQGYLTNEVYQYEHELPQWHRPVAWTLVSDSGYPVYPETLAIRPDRAAELAPCLRRLVPVLQRAAVEYLADPAATNELIVQLVRVFDAYPYSMARATHAVRAMKDSGIMGNGSNTTIGDLDTRRVQRIIDIVRPIFAGQHQPVPVDLEPAALFTNEFIDRSIGSKS